MSRNKKKHRRVPKARMCSGRDCQRITFHDLCDKCRFGKADIARMLGVPAKLLGG